MPRLALLPLLMSLSVLACSLEKGSSSASIGLSVGEPVALTEARDPEPPTSGEASTGSSGGAGATSSTGTSTDAQTGEVLSSGTEAGSSSSSGTGESETSETGEASTGEAPVLVDCFDCVCDINVSFCRKVFGGVMGGAAKREPWCPLVAAEGQESGCVLYPPGCDEAPSCACLPTMAGNCYCNELSPGNFQVTCPLP